MSALLFAPPKIVLQTTSADWVSSIEENAVLFTDKSASSRIEQHLNGVFSRIEYFNSFNDNDLVEKRAIELHSEYHFSNIVAFAEIDVLRTARLREKLHLSGPTVADVTYFRDKYKMKQLAQSKGIPVANFKLVHNTIELMEFIENSNFPIVVKPVDGRGSAGVEILRDDKQLNDYLATGDLSKFGPRLAEKFIAGDMYQANGLYIDGKCVLISIVKCVNSCLEFLHGAFLGLHMLTDENPMKNRVITFIRDLLERALPMPKEGLFHVELFHTEDDKILLCEAACRLGGCIVNDEIRTAYGVDVRLEYAKTQCISGYQSPLLNTPMPNGRLLGQLNIPPLQGILKSLPESCPFNWVEFYKLNGIIGKQYDKMAFTNGEVVSFLAHGENENQIQNRFYELADWFAKNTTWANV
jgi:hypothetical protein